MYECICMGCADTRRESSFWEGQFCCGQAPYTPCDRGDGEEVDPNFDRWKPYDPKVDGGQVLCSNEDGCVTESDDEDEEAKSSAQQGESSVHLHPETSSAQQGESSVHLHPGTSSAQQGESSVHLHPEPQAAPVESGVAAPSGLEEENRRLKRSMEELKGKKEKLEMILLQTQNESHHFSQELEKTKRDLDLSQLNARGYKEQLLAEKRRNQLLSEESEPAPVESGVAAPSGLEEENRRLQKLVEELKAEKGSLEKDLSCTKRNLDGAKAHIDFLERSLREGGNRAATQKEVADENKKELDADKEKTSRCRGSYNASQKLHREQSEAGKDAKNEQEDAVIPDPPPSKKRKTEVMEEIDLTTEGDDEGWETKKKHEQQPPQQNQGVEACQKAAKDGKPSKSSFVQPQRDKAREISDAAYEELLRMQEEKGAGRKRRKGGEAVVDEDPFKVTKGEPHTFPSHNPNPKNNFAQANPSQQHGMVPEPRSAMGGKVVTGATSKTITLTLEPCDQSQKHKPVLLTLKPNGEPVTVGRDSWNGEEVISDAPLPLSEKIIGYVSRIQGSFFSKNNAVFFENLGRNCVMVNGEIYGKGANAVEIFPGNTIVSLELECICLSCVLAVSVCTGNQHG